jgi:tetrahydromethanopterin S-methyltransferase subunit F
MTEFAALNQGSTAQSVMRNVIKPGGVMARHRRLKDGVASARLRPAIHVFFLALLQKAWMPGTSPGMTNSNVI